MGWEVMVAVVVGIIFGSGVQSEGPSVTCVLANCTVIMAKDGDVKMEGVTETLTPTVDADP